MNTAPQAAYTVRADLKHALHNIGAFAHYTDDGSEGVATLTVNPYAYPLPITVDMTQRKIISPIFTISIPTNGLSYDSWLSAIVTLISLKIMDDYSTEE